MGSKSLSGVAIKNATKGEVTAVFSTFNVVDKDGDVTLPGAFQDGAEVAISAYDHKTWDGLMPVGTGRIQSTGTEALLHGQFFMDTTHGRDAFHTVKGMGSKQEWSYGYEVEDSAPGDFKGRQVRYLKRLRVHEVSPVWRGVGVNTRTLDVKHAKGTGGTMFKSVIRPHDCATSTKSWDCTAVLKAIPDSASVSELRSVFAWVDGDPEAKGSYDFAHHEGINGPANVRACVVGIARLNSLKSSIPEEDREGVYQHLAEHIRDADQEPPELRMSSTAGLKLNDEAAIVLCDLSALNDRIAEVIALRTRKGRTALSANTSQLLGWIDEELRRTKSLLHTPEEDAAYEYARFLKLQFGELP